MNTTRSLCLALAVGLVPLASPARAQSAEDVQARMEEAMEHMTAANALILGGKREAGNARYDRACEAYLQVEVLLAQLEVPAEQADEILQIVHYNTACARSMQGRTDEALVALKKAVKAGWEDVEHMKQDSDLDPIRETDGYKGVVAGILGEGSERLDRLAERLLEAGPLFDYALTVKTLDGRELALADLKGKVVIVDYWGTWCPPCRKEVPHFVRLKQELGDRLEVVGLTWEHGKGGADVAAKVRAFAEEAGINYPLALLTDRADLAKVPELTGFPTTLFVDRGGAVRVRFDGSRDYEVLRAIADALLAEEAAPAPTPAPEAPAPAKAEDDGWF